MFDTGLTDLLTSAIEFLPKIVAALVLFAVGLVLAKLFARLAGEWAERRIEQPEVQELVQRMTHWIVLIAFTIAALDQVDFDVTAFLTGLGVVSLTVGFALQDIAKNFVAGLIVMARRPFSLGDAVKIGNHTGQIVCISTRDTTIATWDGERVIIPNQTVLGAAIHNYSTAPRLRKTVTIGMGYGCNLAAARDLLLGAVASVEGVLTDPSPMGHAEELGDYAVSLVLRYWVDHHQSNVLDVASNVVVALNEAIRDHGLDVPYPIQDIRVTDVTPA